MTTSSKRFNEQFLNFWFVLNELTADAETTEGISPLFDAAYEAADAEIGTLPCATVRSTEGGETFDLPRFELCANDAFAEVRNGWLAWSLSFHSTRRLDEEPATVRDLREFLVERFERAARAHGGSARLSEVTTNTSFIVTEEATLSLDGL
jgi:hypothetical protein